MLDKHGATLHKAPNQPPSSFRSARELWWPDGRKELSHGEYQVGIPPSANKPLTFTGKNRLDAKRRAMDYWYRHPRRQGLSLRRFLLCCRISAGHVITFYPRHQTTQAEPTSASEF